VHTASCTPSPPMFHQQVRECATALVGVAKALGIAVFLVGHGACWLRVGAVGSGLGLWEQAALQRWMYRPDVHPWLSLQLGTLNHAPPLTPPHGLAAVTKSRELAGPKALEHLVDAVVYLEGERGGELRLLRATKNRFGRVGEVGLFVMRRGGLEAAPSPELLFTNAPEEGGEGGDGEGLASAGAAIGVVVEGARPLLVEIQALSTARQAGGGGNDGGGDDDDEDSDEGSGYGRRRDAPQQQQSSYTPLMRNITGFRDRSRVLMLLEVLSKHTTIKVGWRISGGRLDGGGLADQCVHFEAPPPHHHPPPHSPPPPPPPRRTLSTCTSTWWAGTASTPLKRPWTCPCWRQSRPPTWTCPYPPAPCWWGRWGCVESCGMHPTWRYAACCDSGWGGGAVVAVGWAERAGCSFHAAL